MKTVSANFDLIAEAHALFIANPAECAIAATIVLLAVSHAVRHAF